MPYLKSPELRERVNGYMAGTLITIKCASLITMSETDDGRRGYDDRSARRGAM